MKILHINSYYSDSKLYKNLYDKQIKQQLDIDVFVSVPTNYEMPERDFGDYTVVSKNHRKWDRIWYEYKQTKMLKDLEERYNAQDYDLMHAHSLFTNGGLAYKLYKKYGTEYVVAVRNTDINTFFKKMPHLRKYGIEIMENAKRIIFISDVFKKQIIEQYLPESKKAVMVEKMVTIPNGIDQLWLDNQFEKPAFNKDSKEIKLIYVGKIMKLKNVPTIAATCEELQARGYEVSLKVIGQIIDDSEFQKIKNKPYVSYEAFQPMDENIEKYRVSDIFVMPSFGETFGLVYVEAMSQGLPVLYTEGQGFDGQFPEGEVGYHIDPNSPSDIADKVVKVLENYDQISRNSTENAKRFNWDEISQRYLDGYKRVIEGVQS